MPSSLEEAKHNLCAVGQFDLADALGRTAAKDPKILEYTRYLIALNGCRSRYAQRTRADIIAALWACVGNYSDDENLRIMILIRVEQLVRECSDIESIHGQLEALAAAYAASFSRSFDLQKLVWLVNRGDFDELRRLLPPPDMRSAVDIFGRSYHYHRYGNMDGLANDGVPEEIRSRISRWEDDPAGEPSGVCQK